ncbi:MAG: hypothetical protein U0136_03540 [Bdellovibrionota bacterium]
MSNIAQTLAGHITVATIGSLFATARTALTPAVEKLKTSHPEVQAIYDDLCAVRKLFPKEPGPTPDLKAALKKAAGVFERLYKVKSPLLGDAKQWLAVAVSQLHLVSEVAGRQASPGTAANGAKTAGPAASPKATTGSAATTAKSAKPANPISLPDTSAESDVDVLGLGLELREDKDPAGATKVNPDDQELTLKDE